MDIAISKDNATITAKLIGPITESDGESLKRAFDELLAASQLTVQLDMTTVPVVTSVGIGKMILLYRRLKTQNRKLKIKGIHDNLYGMFTSINLQKMIPIEQV